MEYGTLTATVLHLIRLIKGWLFVDSSSKGLVTGVC